MILRPLVAARPHTLTRTNLLALAHSLVWSLEQESNKHFNYTGVEPVGWIGESGKRNASRSVRSFIRPTRTHTLEAIFINCALGSSKSNWWVHLSRLVRSCPQWRHLIINTHSHACRPWPPSTVMNWPLIRAARNFDAGFVFTVVGLKKFCWCIGAKNKYMKFNVYTPKNEHLWDKDFCL